LRERSHLEQVGALLQDHDKISVALIDPSVYAVLGEFYGYKPGQEFSSILVNTLRRIGFKKVFGTGWGLEYQAGQVAGLLTGLTGVSDDNPLLVSECPSFVKYICQSRPDLIPFLIPLVPSPVLMTGLIRESLSKATGKPEKDIRVVYLTGCTASKTGTAFGMKTSESGQLPDYSLTTREVYRLIRLFGVYPPSLGADAQEDQFSNGSRTGFMGAISGGYIEVLSRILQSRYPGSQVSGDKPGKLRTGRDLREITCESDHFKFSLSSVSGLTGFENYFTEIRTKKRKIDILEVMACQHGCINGGGQPCRGNDRNLRNRLKGVMEWDEKFSGLRMREQLDLPQGVVQTEEKTHVVHRHRQIIK
jgi:iron only hydrogenase large subunit-like protein